MFLSAFSVVPVCRFFCKTCICASPAFYTFLPAAVLEKHDVSAYKTLPFVKGSDTLLHRQRPVRSFSSAPFNPSSCSLYCAVRLRSKKNTATPAIPDSPPKTAAGCFCNTAIDKIPSITPAAARKTAATESLFACRIFDLHSFFCSRSFIRFSSHPSVWFKPAAK